MNMQARIEEKIAQLKPEHLELVNESSNHNVPKGSESHFKLTLVCSVFVGQSLVQRHRTVYALLEAELKQGLHALALHTFTPAEWEARGGVLKSPPCLGGSSS